MNIATQFFQNLGVVTSTGKVGAADLGDRMFTGVVVRSMRCGTSINTL